MNILITGICGFVGSTLAKALLDAAPDLTVIGMDNFIRMGSESNRTDLQRRGIRLFHGDIRMASDFESLPAVDWVIDAAANPSVLAGVDGVTSSRQLIEHNLLGTVNVLEFCKRHSAGFTLMSTSRVYSITHLAEVAVDVVDCSFQLRPDQQFVEGLSCNGVRETFSTATPVSLYGSTKLCSELLALEYGDTFNFPVWINRCGVLAGAGQFGRPDQGIFAYWINAYVRRQPLRYVGFGGNGYQVRDCLHPRDLVPLIQQQMASTAHKPRIVNLGGGVANAMSLVRLSNWCGEHFGLHHIDCDLKDRQFDIPWLVMDSSLAGELWGWKPQTSLDDILSEIALHAGQNPGWLELSGK
jgi:CDP-paratose 2-epimerase